MTDFYPINACTHPSPVSEQEAGDSIRHMIKNINNLLAAASKDDPSIDDKINLIKLKEEGKNADDSDNDIDDNIFDMEDLIESKDSGMGEMVFEKKLLVMDKDAQIMVAVSSQKFMYLTIWFSIKGGQLILLTNCA